MNCLEPPSRRRFLARALALGTVPPTLGAETAQPIIDIHQHTHFRGRTHAHLLEHQRIMGVTQTILLPAGSEVSRYSTGDGKFNGLGGVGISGNAAARELARENPGAFLFGANEVTDLPEAPAEIERYLQLGALVIGEQKFRVECDSPASQRLYSLAADHAVPILLHFQHGHYNLGFDRFHTMLAKFPHTIFIGHAQTWWANIDKSYSDQTLLYPDGPVTPGGLTSRYLSDYPNLYADLSAGSGLRAITRDEDHARDFFDRHQDRLLFGSDCLDVFGRGPGCSGSQMIDAIRRLAPSKAAERKILFENAASLFRLS